MGFKINVNTKQFAKFEADFKKDINEILEAPALMNEIGDFMTDRIRYQARTESPLNKDSFFPGLKPSTIKHRAYLSKYNNTHDTFAVDRPNVTIIGALLNSLTSIVKGPGKVEILFSGTHPRYNGKNGPIGKEEKNSDIAGWLAKKGFVIFDNSIRDNKNIVARVRSIALGYVRRGLKVRNRLSK